MASNYIPQSLDGYLKFVSVLIEKVKENQGIWTHIPSNDIKYLEKTYEDFREYYEITKGPCTSVDRHERNRRKKENEKVLRKLVKFHLHQEPVTDKDRDEMSIPNPKTTRTKHTEVKALLSFGITIKGTNNVIVHFREAGSTREAKPAGCNGLIKYVIKDSAPQSNEDFTHSKLATRTPFTLEFPNEFSGRRIWIIMCWQNARGILGRWTEMQTAIIP